MKSVWCKIWGLHVDEALDVDFLGLYTVKY